MDELPTYEVRLTVLEIGYITGLLAKENHFTAIEGFRKQLLQKFMAVAEQFYEGEKL